MGTHFLVTNRIHIEDLHAYRHIMTIIYKWNACTYSRIHVTCTCVPKCHCIMTISKYIRNTYYACVQYGHDYTSFLTFVAL